MGGEGDIRAYISREVAHLFHSKSNDFCLSIGPFARDDIFSSPSDIKKGFDGKRSYSLEELGI